MAQPTGHRCPAQPSPDQPDAAAQPAAQPSPAQLDSVHRSPQLSSCDALARLGSAHRSPQPSPAQLSSAQPTGYRSPAQPSPARLIPQVTAAQLLWRPGSALGCNSKLLRRYGSAMLITGSAPWFGRVLPSGRIKGEGGGPRASDEGGGGASRVALAYIDIDPGCPVACLSVWPAGRWPV